ncbi:hypothetical protein RHGRI_016229 [Rhododendron griersonianum]|uniref:Uncharacterized protein n=1 Tax=Rhododendron griersonianum TaxID=479676 RepID=A0AAV6JTG0_9ERIC|nr:hypothetical protein RHGRI_016229 [Rhododendron griersonianum]
MEDFDSWSESSSEFGGSEEFTPREEEVGLVNDVEEVDLVLPQSSEFGRDEEFTARDEREEEVDPLVIEGGVDDGIEGACCAAVLHSVLHGTDAVRSDGWHPCRAARCAAQAAQHAPSIHFSDTWTQFVQKL